MFSPCSLFCSGMTSATSLFFCTCAASTQKTIKKNTVSHSNTHTVSWKKWILHTQRATISDLNSPSRLQHCWSSRLWFVTTLTLWRYLACTPSPWCMNPGARRSDSLRRAPLFSLFFCDRSTTPLRAWCEGFFFTGLRWFQSRSQSTTQRRRRRQTLNMKLKQDSNRKWSVGVKNQNSKEGQSVSL